MFGFQVSIDTIVQKTLGLGFQNCKYGLVDVNVKITFVFCFSVNILFKGRFLYHVVCLVFSVGVVILAGCLNPRQCDAM